jgi:hypothetical protein
MPRVRHFFDKLAFRMSRRVSDRAQRFLKANAHKAYRRKGKPIRHSNQHYLLVVVAPNARALAYIAKRRNWLTNCVEVARNVITRTAHEADLLQDQYDKGFLQPRHGKRETTSKGYSTRTDAGKGAGIQFAWYADRPDKLTRAPHCFHIEGRHQGVTAVRRLGIQEPADLLRLDHVRYWKPHEFLYDIDYERLGRLHLNRLSGSRRQRPRINQCGPHHYNVDRRTGGALYYALAVTRAFAKFDPDYDDDQPDVRIIARNVQKFVDVYGRGPYLRRRVSPIVDM